jgi:cytochrome d ubiquinol oxidase subunit II
MFVIVVVFLGLSLLLYCLFGGADFGAGMLEVFSGREFREKGEKMTYRAIGPVWEANHIWLILVVVILFMGFPAIYTEISVALHIPLTIMLLGIILRGCFFTFRHYDAIQDTSHDYYSRIFVISSIFTSLFLGIIAGALSLGRIKPGVTSFYDKFIDPWLNYFSFSVGLFACCIFAFLAAVYLIGETKEESIRQYLYKQAIKVNFATILSGGFVFLAARLNGFNLIQLLLSHPAGAVCLLLATLSLPLLWYTLQRRQVVLPRILAAFQVCMILFAWVWIQFPVVVKIQDGNDLTLFNSHAPYATLEQLAFALLVGSGLILPALFYLLKAFKWDANFSGGGH